MRLDFNLNFKLRAHKYVNNIRELSMFYFTTDK